MGSAQWGNIALSPEGRITAFGEKNASGQGLVNAGIYVFDQSMSTFFPDSSSFSLERDVFPNLIEHGLFGHVTEARLLDIGTPKRLKEAQSRLCDSARDR